MLRSHLRAVQVLVISAAVLGVVCAGGSASGQAVAKKDKAAEAIIVDHTCTNVEAIPDAAIAAAAKVRSVMRHASILQYVGANRDCGLNLLREENARYDRKNMKFIGRGHPGAEAVIDDLLTDDLKSDEPGGLIAHTLDQYDVYGTYIYNTEKWKSGLPNWPYYRDAMLACEKKYPNKRFVWCTITVVAKYHRADEKRLKVRDAFNASVRKYCRENGKILFDIADLMSHDPEGKAYTLGGHESLYSEYTIPEDLIHIRTALGKKQVAKAYWYLHARLAGWSPE